MKQTTERQLSDTTSKSVLNLERKMAKDGWTLKGGRSISIYTFEREIPEPPNPELPTPKPGVFHTPDSGRVAID